MEFFYALEQGLVNTVFNGIAEDDLKIITSQLISIFTDVTIKKYIYEFRK